MSASGNTTYDYIIAGTGCAGLSLAMALKDSGIHFSKVLMLDREKKSSNDRTWCYWSSGEEYWYDRIASRVWDEFIFKDPAHVLQLQLKPYKYRLIQASHFYRHCIATLSQDPRFEFRIGTINEISSHAQGAFVNTDGDHFRAGLVFNSAHRQVDFKQHHLNFVQHFMGWKVKTERACFDPLKPVFMDFSVEQKNDCRFVYLLPFSETEALVEYTGFSPRACAASEYEDELRNYLDSICHNNKYTITETESGVIPMYESPFVNPSGKNVVNIGTAGGNSKASTGFTFYYIQQQVRQIINDLQNEERPAALFHRPARFRWYDRTLLQVMKNGNPPAAEIFGLLFRHCRTSDLLAFLNEETSLRQDLRVMRAVPWSAFLPAALRKLFRR